MNKKEEVLKVKRELDCPVVFGIRCRDHVRCMYYFESINGLSYCLRKQIRDWAVYHTVHEEINELIETHYIKSV